MQIEEYNISDELSALIIQEKCKKVHAPYSGASTYRVDLVSGQGTYLKILPIPHREPLRQYREKLIWLEGKLPVPKVLHYSRNDEFEFLLMSEIVGYDGSHPIHRENIGCLIRKLAQALRQIHNVEIEECPFDFKLNRRLIGINKRYDAGLIDRRKVEEEFVGRNFEELYQALATNTFHSEDLVFTHGDFSVTNVIINDISLGGFIDLADAGVADRYRDLAAMHYSIIRNYGEEWLDLFYKEYGILDINLEKIKFYDVLEAFCCC